MPMAGRGIMTGSLGPPQQGLSLTEQLHLDHGLQRGNQDEDLEDDDDEDDQGQNPYRMGQGDRMGQSDRLGQHAEFYGRRGARREAERHYEEQRRIEDEERDQEYHEAIRRSVMRGNHEAALKLHEQRLRDQHQREEARMRQDHLQGSLLSPTLSPDAMSPVQSPPRRMGPRRMGVQEPKERPPRHPSPSKERKSLMKSLFGMSHELHCGPPAGQAQSQSQGDQPAADSEAQDNKSVGKGGDGASEKADGASEKASENSSSQPKPKDVLPLANPLYDTPAEDLPPLGSYRKWCERRETRETRIHEAQRYLSVLSEEEVRREIMCDVNEPQESDPGKISTGKYVETLGSWFSSEGHGLLQMDLERSLQVDVVRAIMGVVRN